MILESGIVGGIFGLIPELMKTWDRKNERAHEATMMDKEILIAEKRLDHEMKKVDAAMSMAELSAVTAAVKEQGQTARAAGGWVLKASAGVRPIITYWMFGIYALMKTLEIIVTTVFAFRSMGDVEIFLALSQVVLAFKGIWTEEDAAMLLMIVAFWFVDRSIAKRTK